MFSPRSRLLDFENQNVMSQQEYEQALKYGDILSKPEVARMERMLPNCCRLLPQHLDSVGIFCAGIERAEPTFYAIFSAATVKAGGESLELHGRIYHPVESTKQIQEFIQAKGKGHDVRYQGLSGLKAAQAFLMQHSASVNAAMPRQRWDKTKGIFFATSTVQASLPVAASQALDRVHGFLWAAYRF